MNRREVRKKRLDLLMKRDQLQNLLQHADNEGTITVLKNKIQNIGVELELLVLPRTKVSAFDAFWLRSGWKLNKFDYIKFKLMKYTDQDIAEEIKISVPTLRYWKRVWKLPKVKQSVWDLLEPTDFERVMELLEKCEENNWDFEMVLQGEKENA